MKPLIFSMKNQASNDTINSPIYARQGSFHIYVETGTWDEYGTDFEFIISGAIRIEVDDASGEDGAPAPEITFPVIAHIPSFSTITDLEGIRFVQPNSPSQEKFERERYAWEGTLGNDASSLCNNIIEFRSCKKKNLEIYWNADIGEIDSIDGTMHIEGNLLFNGVIINVKDEADLNIIIPKIFNTPIEDWIKNWRKDLLVITEIYDDNHPDLLHLSSKVVYTEIDAWDKWRKSTSKQKTIYRRKSEFPNQKDKTWYRFTFHPK